MSMKDIQDATEKQRTLAGISRSFQNSATIAASAEFFVYPADQDNSVSTKYMPFDEITIENLSSAALNFYINESTVPHVAAANGSTRYNTTPVRSVRIKNISSATTIAVNELTVVCTKNQANSQTVAQALINRFPKFFPGSGFRSV